MQTEAAKKRLDTDGSYEKSLEAICFKIFSIRQGAKPDSNMRYNQQSLEIFEKVSSYYYQRDVTKRFELKPGTYVVVASLFEKNKSSKFLLRYFFETEGKFQLQQQSPSNQNQVTSDNATNNNNNNNIISNKVYPAPAPAPVPTPTPNKTNSQTTNKNNDSKSNNNNLPINQADAYDVWFFAGMEKSGRENFVKEAKLNSQKAFDRVF
jgi:hypothetical protein